MSRVNGILITLACLALAVRQVANVHSVKNGRLLLGVRPWIAGPFRIGSAKADHLDLAPVALALLCPVGAGKVRVPVIFPFHFWPHGSWPQACFALSTGHRSIFVRSRFGSNLRAPVNQPRAYRPDHWPRYDRSGHRTISARSGHRSKCVRFGHRPFYIQFSHRPRCDRSGHRTMSVRSGHPSGCVRFGLRPFCAQFSHQFRLGPSGHQSGLWTPTDWSNQHFCRSGCPFQDNPSGPKCPFGLRHYLLCLKPTMDQGRVSSPPPPRHKTGRPSHAVSPGNLNRGRRHEISSSSRSSSGDFTSSDMGPHHYWQDYRERSLSRLDPIAGCAMDRDDDTQGDHTPSDAGLFRGIAEVEGINYLPGLQGDQSPLIHHEGNVTNNSVTHVPCTTSGFPSRT